MVPNSLQGKEIDEFRQRVLDRLCGETRIAPHEIHRRPTKDKGCYLKTETLVQIANDVFEGKWNTEVVKGPERFEALDGKYVCTVRLDVYGFEPTYDFGINTGQQSDAPSSFKSAITDGLKRVFRKTGDSFGLFIYAKEFTPDAYMEEYKEKHPNYIPPKFGPTFSEKPSGRREGPTAYAPKPAARQGGRANNSGLSPVTDINEARTAQKQNPQPQRESTESNGQVSLLMQKRKEVIDLGLKLGMSRELIDERIAETYKGKSVGELSEKALDKIILSSRKRLAEKNNSATERPSDQNTDGMPPMAPSVDSDQSQLNLAMNQ